MDAVALTEVDVEVVVEAAVAALTEVDVEAAEVVPEEAVEDLPTVEGSVISRARSRLFKSSQHAAHISC